VNWIKNEYGDIPIYITENGVSDSTGTLDDETRVYFYKHYLNELMKGSKSLALPFVGIWKIYPWFGFGS